MNIFNRIRRGKGESNDEGSISVTVEENVEVSFNDGVPHEGLSAVSEPDKASDLDIYSFWIILGTLFLLPVLFIPSLSIPFQFTKTTLVFLGVLIAFTLFLISRLKEGRLRIPFNGVLLSIWLLPIAYFASSIFSSSPGISFFGYDFEIDTFSFMLLMAVFSSLVVFLFRKREQILYSYVVLFIAFILVWVFQGLRLIFGPDLFSFDIFTLTTSNILGKWNDLGIFFGLGTIMTLVTLASLQLSNLFRKILYGMLAVSLFFLSLVNFNIVWIVVGIFALGFFVHSLGITRFNWRKAVPANIQEDSESLGTATKTRGGSTTMTISSLAVLIVSVFFILGSGTFGNVVSTYFNISQIEARPSWETTIDIGRQTYNDNFIFGSGPNTFTKQWGLYKPVAVNETVFWNTDFVAGIGTIPTSFVTTGFVGVVAWVIFLMLFIFAGVRTLVLLPSDNRFSYYISLSSFLAALFLWVMNIFYTPNVVIITLAFFFTAVFVASLRHHSSRFKEGMLEFSNNPKMGFVSVLTLTFLLLLSIVGMYIVGKQYMATSNFQTGIIAANTTGNLDESESRFNRAINFSESDRYYRLLADVNVARLTELQSRTDLDENELRRTFQALLAEGITNAQRSTKIDESNYQNWLALGRVYQSVVPLRIEGAYENAKTTYERALALNPTSPAIYLRLARLEVDNGDTTLARFFIGQAVERKSNYTEAIFLLTQIEIAEGNITEAIASVEAASVIEPNNPVVFFQLGILRYNENDNEAAITALERAVGLNNIYANARYFLGLAYERLGRTEEALAQFENIAESNSENEELKNIIQNLKEGRSPFENEIPPSAPPETRNDLPIEEDGVDEDINVNLEGEDAGSGIRTD